MWSLERMRSKAIICWVYESSGWRALDQLESMTGGADQDFLSLMRSRVSLAKTKAWNQFGSIFSSLEWEGGGAL